MQVENTINVCKQHGLGRVACEAVSEPDPPSFSLSHSESSSQSPTRTVEVRSPVLICLCDGFYTTPEP